MLALVLSMLAVLGVTVGIVAARKRADAINAVRYRYNRIAWGQLYGGEGPDIGDYLIDDEGRYIAPFSGLVTTVTPAVLGDDSYPYCNGDDLWDIAIVRFTESPMTYVVRNVLNPTVHPGDVIVRGDYIGDMVNYYWGETRCSWVRPRFHPIIINPWPMRSIQVESDYIRNPAFGIRVFQTDEETSTQNSRCRLMEYYAGAGVLTAQQACPGAAEYGIR